MKIALIGNQNSGKSTLFNTLTGDNQKIGNWPGVTIEKKSGVIKETNYELIDLPGIYSLNPYTKEESVTSNFIYENEYDVLINIIDCNSISRGLYLTLQLLELHKKMIVVLNMYDIAETKGIIIDEDKLSKYLENTPVLKISAITGSGCEQLKMISNKFEINKNNKLPNQKTQYKKSYEVNEESIIQRYTTIDNILNNTVVNKKIKKKSVTDKIDKIILNKVFAIPIFAIILFFVYYFSIEIIGNSTIELINNSIDISKNKLETILINNNASLILVSLLTDGIISGMATAISFLPQLFFLFIAISFLEKIGYMSRISLIFDKLFRKLGISGNSVISFILGTGCSVPGIMATKTIKNEREKSITAILTPFIPCSAKLPIISLFSSYFFRYNSGIVAISFYILAILIIIISSLAFKTFKRSSNENTYISELPEYRIPKVSQILKDSFEKVIDFIKRTGSVILISSIVVWLLLSYSAEIKRFNNKVSLKFEYGTNIEESILADIGRCFSWLFIPMVGENSWEVAVSSIQGLIAKEQVVSSMAIISGIGAENTSGKIFTRESPFNFFTPVSAYAYVCFNLFSAPCFGAISAMGRMFGSTKKTFKAVAYQLCVAYICGCMVYCIGIFFV